MILFSSTSTCKKNWRRSMGRVEYHALLLILLFLNASMVGCFANDDNNDFANGDALNIAPDPLTAGIFQSVYFKADEAMRY